MGTNLHNYYDQLTPVERGIVDRLYSAYHRQGVELGLKLAGDDRAEKVIDVMAKHILDSRYI